MLPIILPLKHVGFSLWCCTSACWAMSVLPAFAMIISDMLYLHNHHHVPSYPHSNFVLASGLFVYGLVCVLFFVPNPLSVMSPFDNQVKSTFPAQRKLTSSH